MAVRRRLRRASTLVAAALLVAACSGGDDATPSTTTMSPTTTTTPARVGDDRLVVGVLLPTTGEGAQIGRSMIEGVRLAADRINAVGGVRGSDIELIEVDEGTQSTGFDTLIEEGVDAIVGPASSVVALTNLGIVVDAGIVTCSPSAAALALDEYPDDGLFFRTVPSDSLQAVAIAEEAEVTGASDVAVAYLDDAYGRGLEAALQPALLSSGLTIPARVGFSSGDEDLADEAQRILETEAGVIVVLADADDGSRLIAALDDASTRLDFPPIIVNDAMRRPPPQVIEELSAPVREAIRGVAPVAANEVDPELAGLYETNAYDCVNLLALASLQADSDAPDRMATQVAAVSTGGQGCSTYESCATSLGTEFQNIDYNGPSGNTELSTRTGDPMRAQFEHFRFDETGSDMTVGEPFDVASG